MRLRHTDGNTAAQNEAKHGPQRYQGNEGVEWGSGVPSWLVFHDP